MARSVTIGVEVGVDRSSTYFFESASIIAVIPIISFLNARMETLLSLAMKFLFRKLMIGITAIMLADSKK